MAANNERIWESELQRIRGEVILARGMPAACGASVGLVWSRKPFPN